MNKQLLLSAVFAMLLIGCKKEMPENTTFQKAKEETKEIKPVTAVDQCYIYEANGSKIEMHLQLKGDLATGSLTYALKEKDKNSGSFTGKHANNMLLLDYTFQSEGTQSTRQVAFQFKDNQLIEGYGEMTADGTQFKDAAKLKFDSGMPLNKVDCAK